MKNMVSIGDVASRLQLMLRKVASDGSNTTSRPQEAHECPVCQDTELNLVRRPYTEVYPDALASGKDHSKDFIDSFVKCACAGPKELKRLFKYSAITPKMSNKTFDTFSLEGIDPCVEGAYYAAKDYLENFNTIRNDEGGNGLFLGGAPGSGKTHLCLSVVNALLAKGVPVLYYPFVQGMAELKHNYGINDEANRKQEYRMQTVDVLYIDDLFKVKKGQQPSANEVRFVFQVINERDLNNLPTIFSSEWTINELLGIDEAVGSRIFKMTAEYQVLLQGDNLNKRLPERP